ncbi:MAG TPA: hypothetical protein ENN41_06380 [Sediminispirochaeta sp.]|nr:hypothetical protein [Sediminispirochaeta sp.]
MHITIPKALREILGEEAAEGLIELFNNFSDHTHNSVIELLVEKFERRLAEEIGKFRSEVAEQLAILRAEMHGQIAGLRAELIEKIERTHTSTIRWMFLFCLGRADRSAARHDFRLFSLRFFIMEEHSEKGSNCTAILQDVDMLHSKL